jgi:hypothetical protein
MSPYWIVVLSAESFTIRIRIAFQWLLTQRWFSEPRLGAGRVVVCDRVVTGHCPLTCLRWEG